MCASCRLISIDKCRRMRILRYTAIAGRENVVAGTDCGLGGRVHADLAWREMDSNFFVPRHESPALIAEKPICRDQQVRYDSPLEGGGFEPSVPPRKRRPWREAPRPTIVVSRDDLCLITLSSLSVLDLPLATAERPFAERDRWFESTSLQRRVRNEPYHQTALWRHV